MIKTITLHYATRNDRVGRRGIFLLLLLFIIFPIRSQVKDEQVLIPLTDILSEIEDNFSYQFTYADDVIKDISIHSIPKELSFAQVLEFLRQETGLVFTVINETFIAIGKNSETIFVCGIIKERITEKPLQGGTIISNENSTVSDKNGYFQLEISNPKEIVTIDYLGFETLNKPLSFFEGKDCISIYLEPKEEVLTEVLLKNYLVKGISKTKDGAFQVNYNDFGILPGLIEADVLQTIQALPGVQSADETVSNINIRGGTHDQNLILWDGIKMYQSGHFFGLISIFNPSITGKATLIRNGTGAEYTDGVSGTILMKTDTEINQKFRGSIGINLINIDGFADIPIGKKSSLQLSARKSINNLVKTPTYDQYFERISQDSEIGGNNESDIEFDFYDVNLRWHWQISEKDRLRINFLGINNELVFTENQTIDAIRSSRQSSLGQSSVAGGIWYQRDWNDTFMTSIQVYETDYKLKSINADLEIEQRFLQENIVSETGIKFNTNYKFNENIDWLNGYQFIETGISNLNDTDNPVFRRNTVRVVRNYSLYSQLNYKGEKLKNWINFGVKYSYNEKLDAHFLEPRVSYSQKFLDYFNFEILAEFKHQNTSQVINFQNDFLGIEKRRWVIANGDDIPVIQSKQVSLGIQYNRRGWLISSEGYYKNVEGITARSQGFQNDFLGIEKRRWVIANGDDIPIIQSKQASLGVQYNRRGWLISSEGYYKNVEGITARSQGFQNQYEFIPGIGDYLVTGVDFLINKRFNDLSTWLSYSYVNNDYTFETFEEQQFPNNVDITHSLTMGAAYTIKNLKISAGLNWHSGLPTTRPMFMNEVVNGDINYNFANSSRLQQYLRLDVSATYDFVIRKKVKGHIGGSIWNVTNRDNVISNYYFLDSENTPNEVKRSSLSLTPNVNFKVSF